MGVDDAIAYVHAGIYREAYRALVAAGKAYLRGWPRVLLALQTRPDLDRIAAYLQSVVHVSKRLVPLVTLALVAYGRTGTKAMHRARREEVHYLLGLLTGRPHVPGKVTETVEHAAGTFSVPVKNPYVLLLFAASGAVDSSFPRYLRNRDAWDRFRWADAPERVRRLPDTLADVLRTANIGGGRVIVARHPWTAGALLHRESCFAPVRYGLEHSVLAHLGPLLSFGLVARGKPRVVTWGVPALIDDVPSVLLSLPHWRQGGREHVKAFHRVLVEGIGHQGLRAYSPVLQGRRLSDVGVNVENLVDRVRLPPFPAAHRTSVPGIWVDVRGEFVGRRLEFSGSYVPVGTARWRGFR